MIVIDPTKPALNAPWVHLGDLTAVLKLSEEEVRASIEWVLAHPLPGGVDDLESPI